ncbi:sialate O-acetylesterase [Poriferisphaera corsica]|nr:sialate O-acetylesterase [Poriferisphaera corsica]
MNDRIKPVLVLLLLLTLSATSFAQSLQLPAIISDHMVLQRNTVCPIWGKAKPNDNITVSINKQTHKTKVDTKGNWIIKLSPIKSKGPFTLTVKSSNTNISIKDVITGEVWLGSGQSNMEWPIERTDTNNAILKKSNYPDYRIFLVPRKYTSGSHFLKPKSARWQKVTPKSITKFSAVAYYFGHDLHKNLKTPVGMIASSWGGTPAQSWTPYNAMASNTELKQYTDEFEQRVKNAPQLKAEYDKNLKQWQKDNKKILRTQPQNPGSKLNYHQIDFDDSSWKSCTVPAKFLHTYNRMFDGIVWYRTTINLPKNLQKTNLTLSLGALDDYDVTYVNGKHIGSHGSETKSSYKVPRKYKIPASINNRKQLTIAVRITDKHRYGGFKSDAKEIYLSSGKQKLSIAGNNWKTHIESTFQGEPYKPASTKGPRNVSVLYNGMIKPIIPYAIKGVIWYQGEANTSTSNYPYYQTLLSTMISAWRDEWDQPQHDFPFLIVQLTNYQSPSFSVTNHSWAYLREQQLNTHQNVPNTGLAVIIDIGDATNVHPKNKADVGKRLSRWALNQTYNKNIIPSGPMYQSHTISGNTVNLTFDYTDGIKPLTGNKLTGFFITDDHQKYLPAIAKINSNNTISVTHPQIQQPLAVRYGWAANPQKLNLTNSTNIPASPFRTDQ